MSSATQKIDPDAKAAPKPDVKRRKLLKLLSRAVAKSLGDCSILSQVVAPNLLLTNFP